MERANDERRDEKILEKLRILNRKMMSLELNNLTWK